MKQPLANLPDVNDLDDFRRFYKRKGEEAVSLRIVEKLISEIELSLARSRTEFFSIEPIKNGLQKLRDANESTPQTDLLQTEFELGQAFENWRSVLAERDRAIEAYHIRRYCDGSAGPIPSEVFLALARFYRNLPHSTAVQSKFDLAITRAYSTGNISGRRSALLPRWELAARIAENFDEWDDNPKFAIKFASGPIIGSFDESDSPFDVLIREISEIEALDDFVVGNFFETIRTLKQGLGEEFYDPMLVAAAVECNLLVGNTFNYLVAKANQKLGDKLTTEFDLASDFLDTSPLAKTRISSTLRLLTTDTRDPISVVSEGDVGLLGRLLKMATTPIGTSGKGVDNKLDLEIVKEGSELEGADFTERMNLLDFDRPNVFDLRQFVEEFEALRDLDLNDFLFDDTDSPDAITREALSVMIRLENIRQNRLNSQNDLAPETHDLLIQLLTRAEGIGTELAERRPVSERSASSRLLLVSNKLLETRLRIERSILKFTSRHLGIEEGDPASEEPQAASLLESLAYVDTESTSANRWVVIATVLVIVFSAVTYLASSYMNRGIPLPENVEILNPKQLPMGAEFTAAHRHDTVLYVVARRSWSALSPEQKTENLKDLVSSPSMSKLDTVFVIDVEGNLLGDISSEGVNISPSESETDHTAN
jgi:hypothetical protein